MYKNYLAIGPVSTSSEYSRISGHSQFYSATSWKVAGSVPDVIGFSIYLILPAFLTGVSTRNLSGGGVKAGLHLGLTVAPAILQPIV
jgi:hypothetical protein